MAEIDKVKEKISLYKFFLGIITGIILSILGYIFTNYSSIKISLLIISLIAIVILIYAFSLLTYLIIKEIEKQRIYNERNFNRYSRNFANSFCYRSNNKH